MSEQRGGVSNQRFVSGLVPDGYYEVDAARLLLILVRFMRPPDELTEPLPASPAHIVAGHFTPEYYLHKLDFLLRYPAYFAYELAELHHLGKIPTSERDEVRELVRAIVRDQEPELHTILFKRFWRGAYERLDRIESWWYSRELVYTTTTRRGDASPQKHYVVTPGGVAAAERLVTEVDHARWYSQRIALIHRFFGGLSAAEVKAMQYRHPGYREAQLHEQIPNLSPAELSEALVGAFGEAMGVQGE